MCRMRAPERTASTCRELKPVLYYPISQSRFERSSSERDGVEHLEVNKLDPDVGHGREQEVTAWLGLGLG